MKLKLSQKSTSHCPEDTVLMKAFKYFDLNNSGYVTKTLFFRAIEKVGVVVEGDQV